MEQEFSFEKLDQYYNRLLKEYEMSEAFEDLSFNAFMYLKNIHSLGTPSLSELASSMDVKKPSASSMMHKLANKHFVSIVQFLHDKGVCLSSLTGIGTKFIRFQEFADERLFLRISEILSSQELQIFMALWQKILANLDVDENGN